MAAFPMTYTARATLEIGSGSVGAGRAVTTTTASNQVRTAPRLPTPLAEAPAPELSSSDKQRKLLSALCPKGGGGGSDRSLPRGPDKPARERKRNKRKKKAADAETLLPQNVDGKVAMGSETKNAESQKVTLLKRQKLPDQKSKLDNSKKPSKALPTSAQDELHQSTSPLPALQPPNPQNKTNAKKLNECKKCCSKEVTFNSAHQDKNRASTETLPVKTDSNKTEDISGSLPFNSLFPNYYSTNNSFLKSCVANTAANTTALAAEIPKQTNKKTSGSLTQREPKEMAITIDSSPKNQQSVNKTTATNPRTKNSNSSGSTQNTKLKPPNKKKEVPSTSRQSKPANQKNTVNKSTSNNPNQTTEPNEPCKSKEIDVVVNMPFNTLFPNYYNNLYLNSTISNDHGNQVAAPSTSHKKNCSEATAPKIKLPPYNYNTVNYNYPESKTEELTKGPPEILFQRGTAKSRKPSQNNNFLKQYYTNNAYKTNPIIFAQNNDESYIYAVDAFGEGSTYSSYDRSRQRNNNNSEIDNTKTFKRYPGKSKDEDIKLENRSPVRNVKPMTIAKLVDAPTYDESSVTDKRVIDNSNGRHCKRKSGTSDSAIITNTCVDNEQQIKDTVSAVSTREKNKLGVKSKDSVPSKKVKPARKDKKKVVDTKEKVAPKKVELDVPKDIIEDLPKTERKEEEIQATAQISKIEHSNEDISKPIEMKPAKKLNKMIVVDDDGSIELVEMTQTPQASTSNSQTSNVNYFAEQERFFQALESSEPNANICDSNEQSSNCDKVPDPNESSNDCTETHSMPLVEDKDTDEIQIETIDTDLGVQSNALSLIDVNKGTAPESAYKEQYILAELSNNAYVFLTVPKRRIDNTENAHLTQKIREITSGDTEVSKADKKKRNKAKKGESRLENAAANISTDKTILRKLLFEKLLRDGVTEHRLKASGASKKVF